jgi:ApaG protein
MPATATIARCRGTRFTVAAVCFAFDAHERSTMYQSVTRNIEVTVTPQYLADRSSPESGEYFWAYTIEITNRGPETVQLRTRHWRITDAMGRRQEVRGAGVVGKQPVLKPGESFEYTSGVPLPTPSGFMTGSYGMAAAGGEAFDIAIPTFSLDSPDSQRTIN